MDKVKPCGNKLCSASVIGRQRFCSDRCRKAASRTNSDTINSDKANSDKVGQAASLCVQAMVAGPGSYEHYIASPDKYAQRTNPDKINFGPVMSAAELVHAGLKANRVPIPGDWDYVGVGGDIKQRI